MLGLLNFVAKAVLGVMVMSWIRWTVPRLRVDVVIALSLNYCTPIAAAMFLAAVAWKLF